MSQKDDSENDIWNYKPLEKKKKRRQSPNAAASVTKRRCTARKTSKKDTSLLVKSHDKNIKTAESGDCSAVGQTDDYSDLEVHNLTSEPFPTEETSQNDNAGEGPSSGDFCPICQMPFFILVVQSPRWHAAECLDTPRDTCKECPDGLQCSSTIPNHYKKFNHTLLARSRANSDTAILSLSQQAESSGDSSLSCVPALLNNEGDGCMLETSQDSALSVSASSSHSVSSQNNHTGTPQSKFANGLLLLRSPGPEDLKKKKGWLSSNKGQKSISSSQESKKELLSTPVKEDGECVTKSEPSPSYDDEISYSPLSELPAETKVDNNCRKALFNDNNTFKNEDEDSMTLFGDSFSSDDELLAEFIENHLEPNNIPVNEPSSSNSQLGSISSLAPTTQLAASTVAESRVDSSGGKAAHGECNEISKTSIQSPQSIVLERLRETLLSSDNLPLKNLNNSSVQTEQQRTDSPQPSSSQTSIVPRSQTMPPQRGQSKAGQASGLKQTDIGVFFGLKPLKEKEKPAQSGPSDLNNSSIPTTGENSGRGRQRRERQRRSRADATAGASQATETVSSNSSVDGQGGAGRGGTRGWRRSRWNRGNADGEAELPRRCPFYKKIPGTKFAIDAFQYGEIEGITAYFLTHFHSDHYGGLTKNSTFPIYCNRITGNLVKSKLKVAEQYVHVLPMNTEVTVEGVRVILVDANHCPGAAMLLFFLPDGQTVLHTGDFRADPSMETYPELLSCRVQTLYLDTTYCSPEYTFPRQQEVINFAASTAFELVTLNPRTLVVCGSYSVGKEKVFLALAEVLGSKVCLSRDKYNTMCCLESEQIRERITTDWKEAQVHVLPMMQLSFNKLRDHLARFSRQYDQLVAFKPTGWTFSQQVESVEDIQPQISGNVSIYGIPYSEHSSFLEMKRFVQWLQPLKIIPTVNVGSWASRKAMEKCFREWMTETKAKL
ncbi:DNA cross-link repair 1A protein [Acanthochromis polyacanthus]|uniref:DNA cross-link repair 1A protein n=1 Tax=Acanthochromis polyacanthus TaxID=80966 RepID=UPI0022347797|nr:DNA cross-link repair 1A protein [Acanthochromis polyacanthus]